MDGQAGPLENSWVGAKGDGDVNRSVLATLLGDLSEQFALFCVVSCDAVTPRLFVPNQT